MPGGFDTLAHFVHLWVDAYELANGLNSSRVFMD